MRSGGAAAVQITGIHTGDLRAQLVPRVKVLLAHRTGTQDADPQSRLS